MTSASKAISLAALLFVVLFSGRAFAQDPGQAAQNPDQSRTCPDASLFSQKLISDICWECIFPMYIMGVPVSGGGENPPDGASRKAICVCDGNGGVPKAGFGVGFWEPARIMELVREPGCSPAMGGVSLPGFERRRQGTKGESEYDSGDTGMYHYHYYAFPILLIMDLFVPEGCFTDGAMDFDLMYMSEVDPAWNNDQLAFFTNPEAAAVANLPAQMSCMVDAAASAVGEVMDSMFWCAGSWGSMYPLSGTAMGTSHVNMTSLLTARALGAMHRRGLALTTMGEDAMCGGEISPMIPKSQYKISMFFPRPEASDSHVIGETVFNWGFGRTIPVAGEDSVYVIYRWNDCCMQF